MPIASGGLGASLIGTDGRFYAVGGRDASSVLSAMQRFTP